jgi:hypothetical protein
MGTGKHTAGIYGQTTLSRKKHPKRGENRKRGLLVGGLQLFTLLKPWKGLGAVADCCRDTTDNGAAEN